MRQGLSRTSLCDSCQRRGGSACLELRKYGTRSSLSFFHVSHLGTGVNALEERAWRPRIKFFDCHQRNSNFNGLPSITLHVQRYTVPSLSRSVPSVFFHCSWSS